MENLAKHGQLEYFYCVYQDDKTLLAYCESNAWTPTKFADSTYVLRNPRTVSESRTASNICLLRKPQQNKCADKIYVTGICTRNPLKFWNIFKDLSLESRNIQTQNCAPIQCTVWPRNVGAKDFEPSKLFLGVLRCGFVFLTGRFILDCHTVQACESRQLQDSYTRMSLSKTLYFIRVQLYIYIYIYF